MGSDPDSPVKQVDGCPGGKKCPGKGTKKIHKAEREKLKRDQLNDLFLELGLALEPVRQNNGKACILEDAARLLRDLVAYVDSLRKENAALITESRYVTVEKDELKDENIALESEISRLRNKLRDGVQSEPMTMLHHQTNPTILTNPVIPQPSVCPIYVVPFQQEPQSCPEVGNAAIPPTPTVVRKPQPRYPGPSDSCLLELLSRTSEEAKQSGSSEEGSDKA